MMCWIEGGSSTHNPFRKLGRPFFPFPSSVLTLISSGISYILICISSIVSRSKYDKLDKVCNSSLEATKHNKT